MPWTPHSGIASRRLSKKQSGRIQQTRKPRKRRK